MTGTISSHRHQVQWASGLNLLVGIWLFISAFAVYHTTPMMTNNVICGIAVVVLAAIRSGGAYDQAWLSWLNALLGVWVIISPWGVMGTGPNGPSHGMIINNCITGGVVVVLGVWSALATDTQPRTATAYPDATRSSFGR